MEVMMKKLLLVSLFLVIVSPAVAMDEECSINRAIIRDAVRAGDVHALKQVLDRNLPIGNNSLSIFLGDSPTAEVAQLLIDYGADVNERPRNGSISQTMNLPPLRLIMIKPVEVSRVFLQHGADANAMDFFGTTPLCYTTHAGSYGDEQLELLYSEKLELLLSYGADPSMKGCVRGQTILDDARDINPQIVPLLERQQNILALLKENKATNVVNLIRNRAITGHIRAPRN